MKRDYHSSNKKNNIQEGITYFQGVEIEHTPAYGMDTLFVVGMQDPEEVIGIATRKNVQHIYLGANQSFDLSDNEDILKEEEEAWDNLVKTLCEEGFWVTLDFEHEYLEWIQEAGYTEHNKFIPMISVKVPYIEQLGYNACIKIDDKDFNATNKGVWTHKVYDLMDRDRFTQWDQYKSDKIIE
tara:strand:+ start:3884 stop:4432 length:549 start_codon:yes stop_codon:yes gene_type:complete